MDKPRKIKAYLLLDFMLVMVVVSLSTMIYFNYYFRINEDIAHEITYYQAKSMANLEKNCLKSICFNGNGNINHAQTVDNCVFQLGFGRFYCE